LKKFSALSYVVTHWVAGLLTNFKHVAFTHYHLSDFFYPLSFFSFSSNSFWVREAFKLQIPTVALSSSFDAVGSGVFYFIPANLRYFSTLFFFFRVFTGSILSSYNVSLNKLSSLALLKRVSFTKRHIFLLNVRRSFFSYLRPTNWSRWYTSLFFFRLRSFYRLKVSPFRKRPLKFAFTR